MEDIEPNSKHVMPQNQKGAVSNLKSNNYTIPDGIPGKQLFLKVLLSKQVLSICTFMRHLIRVTFEYKEANMVTVFNEGNKTCRSQISSTQSSQAASWDILRSTFQLRSGNATTAKLDSSPQFC